MCRLCNVVVETVEELNLVLGLARLLSNDVFMLAQMSSMVGLPYSVKIFLQIVSKSPIMSIFSLCPFTLTVLPFLPYFC